MFLVDVLVDLVCQRHDVAHCLAELALLVIIGDGFCAARYCWLRLSSASFSRQFAVEAFVDESGAATGYVDQFADQVGIDTGGEILEVEVDIVDTRAEFGGEVVAQVLRIQMVEIGSRHDKGAARLGHLLTIHGQETMTVDGAGFAVSGAMQHRRPEQRVEAGNVLADKVVQLGGAVFAPVAVEVVAVGWSHQFLKLAM